MNYKDYQNARDAAWRILIDCEVDRLPVSTSQLCKQMGVSLKLYRPEDDNDGMSLIVDGHPCILVSSEASSARQRFTAAHELGHIILGHVGKYELRNREPATGDNPIEQAANVFASRILAPACVLWGCNAWEADDIMRLCGISRQAAQFRATRMAELRGRGKFLLSPLEREVYRRFLPYIEANRITNRRRQGAGQSES